MKKIYIITFLVIIFTTPIMMILSKDKLIDKYERKYMAQLTDIDFNDFNKDFELYLADQFPIRYQLRQIKGISNYYIFNKTENNDIIIQNNSAIKLDLNYNYKNIEITINKLNKIINKLNKNKIYFALIPDKNCFYNNKNIQIDYEKIYNIINQNIENTKLINLYDKLTISDYYKTDSHWSQENLINISDFILTEMNNKIKPINYKIKTIKDFNGVYKGQAGLPISSDEIKYLTNTTIDKSIVYNYETNEEIKVYTTEKLKDEKSLDKYDIFLTGPAPLLRITNKNSNNNKTLIIFRDSYASSITPLFIEYYNNIYLIDLRYIDADYINNYITINNNDDILFLYSTTLLEMPNNFKIK